MAWVDELLVKMVEMGASDLHLSSNVTPYFRVDGDMAPIPGREPTAPETMQRLLEEMGPPHNVTQFADEWDTDFAYELAGVGRFRVNFFYDRHGPGSVMRHIPQDIPTADKLRLPKAIIDFCGLRKGLVVVTGPTGSGKSTTLAAMIDHINRNRKEHIITIEDPVEFVHDNLGCLVNQREVHRHTKGFKPALRAALREDPDIVLVGEMRDLETVEIAIETAETGHLVFGTLHTSTAASTVDRIIDQFSADRQAQIRTMLSTSLKGVVAQTLCKKKGGGRVAAHEILVVNDAVSSLIRDGKTYQIPSAMQVGSRLGMCLLNHTLTNLVREGLVEPGEAYSRAINKAELLNNLKELGVKIDPRKVDMVEESQSKPGGGAAPSPSAAPPIVEPMPSAPAKKSAPSSGSGSDVLDPFEEFRRKQQN